MKQIINLILSILSVFAAAPTGWAIYAGVTKQDVFPMWIPAAVAGALAIISTSIAAGLLITDILAYNQGMKNKTEREEFGLSPLRAWLILGGCVLAEITLSLLIVVIPGALVYGVLVFPLMTAAGVFAFAARFDLLEREQQRTEARLQARKEKDERPKPPRKQKQADPEPAIARVELAPSETKPAFVCSCGYVAKSQAALNGHKGKHKQAEPEIIAYTADLKPIIKEQAK